MIPATCYHYRGWEDNEPKRPTHREVDNSSVHLENVAMFSFLDFSSYVLSSFVYLNSLSVSII